jgi:hypothetical protein
MIPNSAKWALRAFASCAALPHQQIARPVQHEDALLFSALDGYEAHGGARDRLADRFRVGVVVLAPLDIGLHVGGWHETNLVPKRRQFASPMVCRRTGFHADKAGLKR